MPDRIQRGFTLIEVMITVAIVAILAAIAYPSYTRYVLRGHRAEGQAMLAEAAAREERYFVQNGAYTSSVAGLNMNASSDNGYYQLTIANVTASGSTYTLTATPQGAQANDTDCAALTLDQAGTKGISGGTASEVSSCWR